MASKNLIAIILFLFIQFHHYTAQSWVKAGYWYVRSVSPIPEIESSLFTHLICAFIEVNSSTYQVYIPSGGENYFSIFTSTVRRKNPSVQTLISVWDGLAATAKGTFGTKSNFSVISLMLKNSLYRQSFIQSSIRIARLYGFQGIDLLWFWPAMASDMVGIGILLDEWRVAINSESKTSSQPPLILTMAVHYSPVNGSVTYPIESMRRNLDWGHVVAYDYHLPSRERVTKPHAALFDPLSHVNTDYGVREWLSKGFPASKLVLGLPYHGYAWTLENLKENGIGSPSLGLAETADGSMSYNAIKQYIQGYGAVVEFNAAYVVNHCTIGSTWINYDDVEAIKAKINYAKEKKLLGYNVFQVVNDENGVLSRAAQELGNEQQKNRKRLLIIILTTTAAVIVLLLLLAFMFFRRLKLRVAGKGRKFTVNSFVGREDFSGTAPDLQIFSFTDIEAATNKFAFVNKLGQGGYGPVYKGVLPNGRKIAVKRLSKTSRQGFEEFKNEVLLTARLQHINLVKVLGFCVDTDEQMLIYEFMRNKSLDFYLFCPERGYLLNWRKRVEIIEGVTQGLLYLQEYSRLTVIHRDLKPSNILLDDNMKPKISDFGMARIFTKDELEANTSRIAGTYGYVPPEYVKKGLYSTKSDVYSFGVLLLQIISGKKTAQFYGVNENLNLLAYAYELWKAGIGMEFMDPSLNDTDSTFKLTRCMQIALLCVQENANDRPSMLEISSMLKNMTAELKMPEKPAFYAEETQENQHSPPLDRQTQSFCNPTVSEVVGR